MTAFLAVASERWRVVRPHAERWAADAAVALGATIPISVSADGALTVAVLVLTALGGRYRDKLVAARGNGVAVAAAALLGLLALGLLWGDRNPGDGPRYLGRYADLALIAVLVPLFRDAAIRRAALAGFAIAIGVTLALSYALHFGLIGHVPGHAGSSGFPTPFKSTITQNILVAFGALQFALAARDATSRQMRWLFGALALLAVHNVVFVVSGRTGYAVLAALLVYLAASWAGWRGLVVGAGAALALFAAAFLASQTFHQRLVVAIEEYQAWSPDRPAMTSIGYRLEFYRNTAAIIAEHPLLGVGTGGFARAYADRVAGTGADATSNPHNEYLMVAAQLGPLGLVLLLTLFVAEWRLARRLPTPTERHLARGLVLTIAVGCLFNTLLLDHTEGLFHAWMAAVLFGGLAATPPERKDASTRGAEASRAAEAG